MPRKKGRNTSFYCHRGGGAEKRARTRHAGEKRGEEGKEVVIKQKNSTAGGRKRGCSIVRGREEMKKGVVEKVETSFESGRKQALKGRGGCYER